MPASGSRSVAVAWACAALFCALVLAFDAFAVVTLARAPRGAAPRARVLYLASPDVEVPSAAPPATPAVARRVAPPPAAPPPEPSARLDPPRVPMAPAFVRVE